MRRRRNGWSPAMGMVIASGFFLMVGLSKASEAMGAAAIPIWAMAIGGVAYVLKGPMGDALMRALTEGDRDPDQVGTSPEVLQELDDLRAQLSELQERVDFSERLLARDREMRPLSTGERT